MVFNLIFMSFFSYSQKLKRDQHIIQFKSGEVIKEFLKKVDQQKIEVAARGDSFIVIRPRSFKQNAFYFNFLKEVSGAKDIEFIKEDKIIYPEIDGPENPAQCLDGKPVDSLLNFAKYFTNVKKLSPCRLDEQCQKKNLSWAKHLTDADLAEKEVQELLKLKGAKNIASVAVVDSGFNYGDNLKNLTAEKVKVAKGFDRAGDEFRDEGGHGTAVSGMIAAKGVGITSAINLNIYRTTEGGQKGIITSGFLAASIEKACRDSDIVNVSWGSDSQELGIADIERELWYRKAQKMGCLIIKSSGNSGIKKKLIERKTPEDAPVLLVGAINHQGQEATFSTASDIKAPGEGVFTLVSNDVTHQSEFDKKRECIVEGVKYAPINGTSFSSPVVAGVAGQVVTVLKLNKTLPKDPTKKIKLIKNILKASALSNSENLVNAYRAVKIAGMIKVSDGLKSPQQLSDALDLAVGPQCESVEDCRELQDCQKNKTCFDRLRNNVTLCKGKEDRQQLISLLNEMKEYDLLTGYLPLLQRGDISEKQIDQMLAALWENNIANQSVDSIQTAFQLMKLAKRLGRNDFIDAKKFQQIFTSTDFVWRFNVHYEIGENAWVQSREQFYPELIELFSYLPYKDQKKLIEMNMELDSFREVKAESLSFLLIADKYKEKLPGEVSLYLTSTLDKLSDKFLNGDLIKDVSNHRLDQSPVLDFLVKHNPRGKEILRSKLNGTLSKEGVKFMVYALASKQIYTPEERRLVSREILKQSIQKPRDLRYATEQGIKILMDSDQESDANLLKKTLLSNPYTVAEYDLKTLASTDNYAKKKLLTDKSFWSEYLEFSLDNTKKFIKGDLPISLEESGSAIKTLSALIETNAIDDQDKIEILKRQKHKIQEVLSEGIKRSQFNFFSITDKNFESKYAIEEFSENYEWLKGNGIFQDQDIEELKKVVRKDKDSFPRASENLGL